MKRTRSIPTSERLAVLHRANHCCEGCGAGYPTRLQFHHKIAFVDGGTHEAGNLEVLCRRCHWKRHGSKEAPPVNPAMLPDVLLPLQAAAILQISLDTLYRDAIAGRLPGFKIGRQWRFWKADLLTLGRGAGPAGEGQP